MVNNKGVYDGLLINTKLLSHDDTIPYPSVVIWDLIWLCDMDLHITHLISHSTYFCCHMVIEKLFVVGCIINTKLPSCVDLLHSTSLGFPSWCPENRSRTGCQMGNLVQRIISTHMGSFIFYNSFNQMNSRDLSKLKNTLSLAYLTFTYKKHHSD